MSITVFLFFICIIYFVFKSKVLNSTSPYSLLRKVLVTQRFSNIANIYANGSFYIVKADADGENYIFGVKTISSPFTNFEVEKLYELGTKAHIHTIVLATTTPITSSNPLYRKIQEYGFDIWDGKKLTALSLDRNDITSSSPVKSQYSILKTSDTSDDTCEIAPNTFDPIQDGNLAEGLFSRLFDRPTHL